MTSPHLSTQQVLDAGVDDWRKLAQALHTRYSTGGPAASAAFIAEVLAAVPTAEVRAAGPWVEIKLATHEDGWWVTEPDVEAARRISALAADRSLVAEPEVVAQVELGLDTATAALQGPFWAALLTGDRTSHLGTDVIDPAFRVPNVWFQETDPHPVPRQRFHIDLWLAHDIADERIAAAVAAGGTVADDSEAPSFVVLADPEGNRVRVCTALGRYMLDLVCRVSVLPGWWTTPASPWSMLAPALADSDGPGGGRRERGPQQPNPRHLRGRCAEGAPTGPPRRGRHPPRRPGRRPPIGLTKATTSPASWPRHGPPRPDA